MSDEQELSPVFCQDVTTQQLQSTQSTDRSQSRCTPAVNSMEMQAGNPVQVSVSNVNNSSINSGTDHRRLPSPFQVQLQHPHPTAAETADPSHRAISWSTSDVQSAADADPSSGVVCPPPVRDSPWSYSSLTRGSSRTADERLVWASSMPTIPGADNCQPAAEPTVTTKDWLDSLHRKKNARPISRSTDHMYAVSVNPAGGPTTLGSLAGTRSTPSRSTLASSDESFVSCRESVGSRDSVTSKKRRVRFELGSTASQRVPDQRSRSRSQTDRASTSLDGGSQAETTSRAQGSLLSKFRRAVVDGVGAIFGLSKQKNGVDEPADAQLACNGHIPTGSFDDMTEMERLAIVADRVASERLHTAVMHGKLPTENGGYRASYRSPPSSGDMENMEACFAGLSLSSSTPHPRRNPQELSSWRGNASSGSVSEELSRLPSNACSSYVQFLPKSTSVPCSMVASSVEPPNGGRKPPASTKTVANVVTIECQCGSASDSKPVLPIRSSSDPSRAFHCQPGGENNSGNRRVQPGVSDPHAEPSTVSKSASQPAGLSGDSHEGQLTAVPRQGADPRRSTSDADRLRTKPQPPPKVFLRSTTSSFREGLLPTPEDFRIRRQAGATNRQGSQQNGPLKATVPFLEQRNILSPPLPPPPPPPTRGFAADVCGLSSELDCAEAGGMTLQELSALVDRELQANRLLEMSPDLVQTSQAPASVSNHVDATPTSGWQPAAQSKDDVDAQLKSLGFDEDIWNLGLDEDAERTDTCSDDDEDSASTLTDGSVVTVTMMSGDGRSASPSTNDLVDPGSGSMDSVHDPFYRSSALGCGPSYSLPAISDLLEGDPAHTRCSSTDIPIARTCGEDARRRWGLPVAFSFNQLTSGTTAAAYHHHSKSSGIGSLFDSGSMPGSPLWSGT